MQQPHPPTRVAAASADTYTQIGKLGHPIFISANTPIPQLQERLADYRACRQEAGHEGPGEVVLRIPAYVAETAEAARSEPQSSTMHAITYAADGANQDGGQRRGRRAAEANGPDTLRGSPAATRHVRHPG